MLLRRAHRRATAVVLVAVLFAACQAKFKDEVLGQTITKIVKEKLGLDTEAVECPKEAPIAPGTSFDCTVRVKPKGTIVMTVTVKDDTGNIDVKTKHNVILPAKLESEMNVWLGTQKVPGTADCRGEVHMAKPGDQFTCALKGADGSTATFLVDVAPDGNVSWKVK